MAPSVMPWTVELHIQTPLRTLIWFPLLVQCCLAKGIVFRGVGGSCNTQTSPLLVWSKRGSGANETLHNQEKGGPLAISPLDAAGSAVPGCVYESLSGNPSGQMSARYRRATQVANFSRKGVLAGGGGVQVRSFVHPCRRWGEEPGLVGPAPGEASAGS